MAIVVPAPGTLKETAQLLLSLARDVRDVRTVGNGTQFDVPDYLADAYGRTLDAPAPASTGKRRGRTPRATKEGSVT